jgi:NADP-dependent alcohol dehydrogenase
MDHARSLAVVLPGLWKTLREEKKEKLLQYGERVWGIKAGTDEQRVNDTIQKTVNFFESLGIQTRLSDYKIETSTIDEIVRRFESRAWLKLGDRGLTTPAVVRKALEWQL